MTITWDTCTGFTSNTMEYSDSIDWATLRFKCNADGVFKMVRAQMAQDVDAFNECLHLPARRSREIVLEGADSAHYLRATKTSFDSSRDRVVELASKTTKSL